VPGSTACSREHLAVKLLIATGLWFPDVAGGLGRVAAETARRLAARGHDVTVIAPRHAGAPKVARDGRLEVRRVLVRTPFPTTLTDVMGTLRAARTLRGEAFDLVVAHQATTAVGALAARTGAPLALVYHASAGRELRFFRTSLRGLGPQRLATYALEAVLLGAEHIAISRAARILVLSEFSRSLIKEDHSRHADRVISVLGGVDVDRFAPISDARERLAVPSETRLLVTARRLEPRMGIDQLLRAVVRVPEANLAVIGAGVSEHALRRLSERLGVGARTRFLGHVSDVDLRTWYAAADVVVMPTAAYEGFGLVTAEALACGTPVVATPVGALPELLGPLDPRLVAANAGAEAIADAIKEALSIGGRELRARCREYAVSRFGWETVMTGWEQALEMAAGVRDADTVAA
jgi:glycosyltransferase involved in cell wall biosynthesis